MTFRSPGALILLTALLPALVLMAVNYKRRVAPLCGLLASLPCGFGRDAGARKPRLRSRYLASCLFMLVCIASLCVAAAGPQGGVILVREPRYGADIVFAFDLSRSMDARDAPPLSPASPPVAGQPALSGASASSRLERSVCMAREALGRLLGADGGSGRYRFGAALGKGAGVLAVPLTADAEALLGLLDSLGTASLTSRGTNLERLLDAAAGAFQSAFPSERVIVLFSDGEELSGSIDAAAERARASEITLFAAGAGSLRGVPIRAEAAAEGGAHPPDAPVPVSRLRRDVLAGAAERTGGAYIDGNAEDAAALLAGRVMEKVSAGMEDGGGAAWGFREERAPLWRLFVLAGLAALLLSRLCLSQLAISNEQ